MPNIVDRLAGLSGQVAIKQPARVQATSNITLSGLQTIDGEALAEGDRVIAAGQTSSVDNGIYNATSGAWTRALDFDGNRDIVNGTLVMVVEGSDPGRILKVSGTDPIQPGTSAITFSNATVTASIPSAAVGTAGATSYATRAEINADDADESMIPSEFLGSKFDPNGEHCVPLPAASWYAATTNGAASGQIETASNAVNVKVWDFDTTTQEFICMEYPMPESWNEGTVTFKAIWTAASGSGGVAWALQGVATSDDDALDVAYGTEQVVTDTLITANDRHITTESSAITIAGTPQAGDVVNFRCKRVPANASDTLAVDARLTGIRLYITTTTGTDA